MSHNPSSKVTRPTVPAENLSHTSSGKSCAWERRKIADEQENDEVHREPNENHLVGLHVHSMLWWNRENA
jgi:hypothetical protein